MEMEGPLHAFQYQPLESVNTIRVVILEPAEDHDDPLKAQLLHVNRERLSLGAEKIAIYEAVSYCWDDPTPASSLIVDENLDLPITRNVDVLLRYLRSRTKHRYLWIDGICMDQQNNGEKEVQVRLMGRIYAQATKVHVWLGVETRDDNVHGVFNALKWMAMCLKNKTLPTLGDLDYFFKFQCGPDWPAKIRQFFARPYFSRRWILQEIALGHHTTIRCGPWKLSWQWFIGGVIGLQRMIDGEILLGFTETHSRLNTIVAIEDSTNHKLLALLWRFHESRCSVAHDTIFALYGLAQDALANTSVDYSSHWSTTFAHVAGLYFREDKKSIWLHLMHFGSLFKRSPSGSLFRYPSWVPDWNNTRKQGIIMPDSNTALLSLNGFRHSSFVYRGDEQMIEFDCYYAGRVTKACPGTGLDDSFWDADKMEALAEVLSSFFQRHTGSSTDEFKQAIRNFNTNSRVDYRRETLVSALFAIISQSPSSSEDGNRSLQTAIKSVLESIWASYQVVCVVGKRDAIGLCSLDARVGDVLIVPPQSPRNSFYWPYKAHPLFGVIVRPDSDSTEPTFAQEISQPNHELRGCRYIGVCSYALWVQENKRELNRVSVQLI